MAQSTSVDSIVMFRWHKVCREPGTQYCGISEDCHGGKCVSADGTCRQESAARPVDLIVLCNPKEVDGVCEADMLLPSPR